MELVTIGEAARRLGLKTSALRYYEERGIVVPAARHSGRRMYGPQQLRRLAFIQMMQRLGASLDVVAAMLDGPRSQWQAAVAAQITALDDLIEWAEEARGYLEHELQCPTQHPVQECSYLITMLDRRLAGATFEALAAEHSTVKPR